MGSTNSTRRPQGYSDDSPYPPSDSSSTVVTAVAAALPRSEAEEFPTSSSVLLSELKDNHHRYSRNTAMGTLVVVKEAPVIDITKDPTQLRLNTIPLFNPILHHRDKLAWSKEGDTVRHKLNPGGLLNIGLIVQSQIRKDTLSISKQQNILSSQVKETEQSLKQMIKGYTDRQRAFAKHAEVLGRINDFAHLLAKCQAVLNDCRRSSQLLNNLLPDADRLEPFVWTEDTELIPLNSRH